MNDADDTIADFEPVKTTEQKTETQTVKTPKVTLTVSICSLLICHCFIMD